MNQSCRSVLNISRIFIIVLLVFLITPWLGAALSGCGLYYLSEEGVSNTKQEDEYKVIEVIDGDTFVISNNEHVRLIGINSPEIDRYFYREAKDVLKLLVLNKNVRLEQDVEDRDTYGRLLRYVFIGDLFVNLEMVKRGFANVFTFPPNIKYTDEFIRAEKEAVKKEAGLWEKSNSDNIGIRINSDSDGDDRKNLNGEYAVFKNNNKFDINLDGWTVKDLSTNTYDFRKIIFKSGSEIILYSGHGKDLENRLYWNSPKPIWNNDHDTLYLRDKNGLMVGLFNY